MLIFVDRSIFLGGLLLVVRVLTVHYMGRDKMVYNPGDDSNANHTTQEAAYEDPCSLLWREASVLERALRRR